MYNSIILSSCLFGSFYLTSISLGLINKTFLQSKKIRNKLIIINGFIFFVSGTIVLYNFSLLNSLHFYRSSKTSNL